jgi:FG-GAP-like repeat/FG-GAP repeat/IPT/TIG domain
LAVANNFSNTVSVFRNTSTTGSISYAAKVDFTTGNNPSSISIGDLDGDGKADLAVANYNSTTVSVFRNTSTGPGSINYAANVDFTTGSSPLSVSIGDLDGDGKTDLAVANLNSNTVSLFRNTSTGSGSISYAAKVDFATGSGPYSVSIGDLDGDGKADLAVVNVISNTVSLFRNTSTGSGSISYAAKVDFTTGSSNPSSVSIGDLDGDGKADLAVANGNTVSVLRNKIPSLEGFSPSDGAIGTQVVITGTEFSTVLTNNIVKVNGTAATVTASTGSSLTITISVGATTGKITVDVAGQTLTSATNFSIFPPTITSFAPVADMVGASVTITGTYFSATPANNLVKFNGATAVVTASTITSITATVPVGATTGKITVTIGGLTGTSTDDFIVLANQPVSQPSALVFSSVTTSSMIGSFTAATGSPAGYIVLQNTSAITDLPVDGTPYTTGSSTIGTSSVISIGSGTTFSSTGLSSGVQYYYAIYAYNGATQAVNYRTAAPLANSVITVSAAPAATAATAVTQTSFSANWSAVTGATGYLLDVSIDNFSNLITGYAAKSVSGLTDAVTGLTLGTTYQYRVRAANASGLSANSNTITQITIPATPVAANVPSPASTSFTASWNAIAGATGYELDVSTNNFVTNISGYDARPLPAALTQELVSSLSPTISYQYRVRSVNLGGVSPNSNAVMVTTLSGPGASALTVSNPSFTNSATASVSVTLSNGSGARTVKFYSRGIIESTFRPGITLTSTSDTYSITLTPSLLDQMGIEFYFTAEDATTPSPKRIPETRNDYIYKPVAQGEIAIPGLSFGGDIKNYRLISIPYALATNNTLLVFSALGAYDKNKWRLLQWNGTAFADNPGTIALGKSYWFNAKQQTTIELGAGTVSPNNQVTDFSLSLQQGWNMIATPYPFAIDWDDILDANGNPATVDRDYFVFNPATVGYTKSNSLKPFEGGFVYADAATQLKAPVLLKNSAGGRKQTTELFEKNLDEKNWHLPLTLRQGGIENSLGAVGMHEEARQGKDQYDRVVLPNFLKYVQLTTEHREAFIPYFIRDVVPPQDAYTWNFNLEASDSGPIELSWDVEAIKNSKAQLLLYDRATGSLVDMRTKGTHTLAAGDGATVQFIYARSEYISLVEELATPYPNPFSTEVKLPGFFNATGEDTQITVSIISMSGVEVFQAQYSTSEKGLHQPVWKGVNVRGETIPSGLYLYKVTSSTGSTTIKTQGKIIKQ